MYQERPARIPGAVVWRAVTAGPDHRVLPDGCMDLIWSGGRLFVAGPDTVAQVSNDPAGTVFSGIRFAPGTGPGFIGLPARELRDRLVPVAELWPSALTRRFTDLLAEAADPRHVLENIAADRLHHTEVFDPLVAEITARVRAGHPVSAVADTVGYSDRQLHRRCLDVFGYGAKTLGRILRMNRALDLARTGTPFAAVATRCGYADQAHLAREVKALAGVPMGVLIRA